jgi:hypothetical protein
MYHSDLIANQIANDKQLAKKLDAAVVAVRDQFIDQTNKTTSGLQRLLYHLSCITDNYQDVCSRLKGEDIRFIDGLITLIRDRRIIYSMLKVYLEEILKYKNNQQLEYIKKLLLRAGVRISVSTLSNQSFIMGVTTTLCLSVGFNRAFLRYTRASASWAIIGLTGYGNIQAAAESAERLQHMCPWFYQALYIRNLDMMYFIVESFFVKSGAFSINNNSEEEIANTLIKMMR